jgi:hypothetical protein
VLTANKLMYYDYDNGCGNPPCEEMVPGNAAFPQWEDSGPNDPTDIFNQTTNPGGCFIPKGYRSLLCLGSHGYGNYCYGVGTTENPPPGNTCYDEVWTSSGPKAYPYRYQIWAIDLQELAEVKAGTRSPNDVHPYDQWELVFPIVPAANHQLKVNGVAYDSANNRLYVGQYRIDGGSPVIWRYTLAVP